MATTFGALLRRLRLAANLSQEALAEAAKVSTSAIGAYERGVHAAPHRNTVVLLADALHLTPQERSEFESAARRKPRASLPVEVADEPALNNLPVHSTSFVGRGSDVNDIEALLRRHALVTLTGIGGIGKTRTAVYVAQRIKKTFRHGVVFVDFGSITDEGLAVSEVASSLKIQLLEGNEPVTTLTARLRDRNMLLVLDNCEHIIEVAGRLVSAILRSCPDMVILATSRERLRLTDEAVYRMSVLDLPTESSLGAEAAVRYAAIRLFVDRAVAVDRRFSFSDADVQAVMNVCRRLGGVPLAIELAASRLPAIGIAALDDRLALHFSLVMPGSRDAPTRQRTLQATLAWSYDLLETEERVVFRRLSVFAASWSLAAAQAVCKDDGILTEDEVFDRICSLVEKSLISVDVESASPRYRMLEVTRAFARQEAKKSGEDVESAQRHAAWLAQYPRLATKGRLALREATELENVRGSLEWALGEHGDVLQAASIVGEFRNMWLDNGREAECRRWAKTILDRLDEKQYPHEAARLLRTLSLASPGTESIAAGERAIELLTAVGDFIGLGQALMELGFNLRIAGQMDQAELAIANAAKLAKEHGWTNSVEFALILHQQADFAGKCGRSDEALALYAEAIKIATALHGEVTVAALKTGLAEFHFRSGDTFAAIDCADEAIEYARQITLPLYEMFLLCNRAAYLLNVGYVEQARGDALLALKHARGINPRIESLAIQHIATVGSLLGQPVPSARLLGFVEEYNKKFGLLLDTTEQSCYDILMESLRAHLSPDVIAQLGEVGAGFGIDEAIEEALELMR